MSNRFEVMETPLPDLFALQRLPISDNRGYLERMFCAQDLQDAGIDWTPVQINRTLTHKKGTARGFHFQRPPHCESKIVSCLRGCVFDVAVDLRRGSPTFLQWHGVELSDENRHTLIIPEGFAHGFQTLTDDCELLYFHSAYYAPEAESGVTLTDSRLAVAWPAPITETSERDARLPFVDDAFEGLEL